MIIYKLTPDLSLCPLLVVFLSFSFCLSFFLSPEAVDLGPPPNIVNSQLPASDPGCHVHANVSVAANHPCHFNSTRSHSHREKEALRYRLFLMQVTKGSFEERKTLVRCTFVQDRTGRPDLLVPALTRSKARS
ncbi:hypothetical protein B0T22DRAFT_457014 [Podospora appendiculata]|uniref:Uncharacterized protein n=1 Tax=Podospora appendiculata TaxID=314037 RepID=A0AAE0X7A7_9PEZI|nr:hypothetical protein B0T22DRAFT_457014 [Podospora appendiculata]